MTNIKVREGKETKSVFRIRNRKTGKIEGSYERGNYTKTEFSSAEAARMSNCHDIFQDRDKYAIEEYRVTYELVEADHD